MGKIFGNSPITYIVLIHTQNMCTNNHRCVKYRYLFKVGFVEPRVTPNDKTIFIKFEHILGLFMLSRVASNSINLKISMLK